MAYYDEAGNLIQGRKPGASDVSPRRLRGLKPSRRREMATGFKFCRHCGQDKPLDDFPTARIRQWTYQRPECLSCHSEIKKKRYAATLVRDSYLKVVHRARRRGVTAFMSFDEWIVLNKETNCHWCDMELHPSFRNFDHVIPISRGGQHTADNVVASCANCNVRRSWEMQTKYKEGR